MRNPITRARRFFARARGMPGRLDAIEATLREIDSDAQQRSDALREAIFQNNREATHQLYGSLSALEDRIALADGAVAEAGVVTRVALDAARRDASTERLLGSLGPASTLRAGLSIFTITWNHADRLGGAIESGLAVLDAVGDGAGEMLVLDNGSTDDTGQVLEDFARRDNRVRIVRASENLGLSRARNVLLHCCDREHALMLDADNRADAPGATAVFDVARRYRSLLTYGVLEWRDDDGVHRKIGSAGPVTAGNLELLDVDTFMVVDVAGMRRLGGWTLDPVLHAFDDQELVRRAAAGGELIGFVPVVLGTYHITPDGHSRVRGDVRPRRERIERMYPLADGSRVASFVAHPDVGPLWTSQEAARRSPVLRPPTVSRAVAPRRRVLVVAPGGVGNLGDDLITAAVVERVRTSCPDHDVELVTDGPALAADLGVVAWTGTLGEVVDRLGGDERLEVTSLVDLSQIDCAVLAGGGNLNSLWNHDLVVRRSRLGGRLHAAGVPLVATGQGIGPFSAASDAENVAALARTSSAFAVRDSGSREELERRGVASDVVGDDALGLSLAGDGVLDDALDAIGVVPGAPIMALHVRDAPYVGVSPQQLVEWSVALDAIATQQDGQIVGVALNHEEPHPESLVLLDLARAAPRRAPWRILDEPTRPTLVFGVFARAKRALVSSYHAALVSIDAGVPALYCAGTDYTRGKAEGLARLAGLPDAFVVSPGVPADEIAARFADVERALTEGAGLDSARGAVAAWLPSRLATLRQAADRRSA